jgi:outer membrane cobalamin receptor
MTSGYRIILVCLLATYTPVAQAQDTRQQTSARLLDRPARLEVHEVPLEAAVRQLSRRSGVPFAFSPDLLRGHGTVSCFCRDATVSVALDSLLTGTGLVYGETAHRVVLSPPVTPRAVPAREGVLQPGTLVGHVRAAPDGQPINGARVQVSGRLGEVRTDATGLFRLTLAPGQYDVVVQALAYAPQRLRDIRIGHGDTTSVTVTLDPAPIRLDELVVTPGTYGILKQASVVAEQTLTRDYVNALPRLGDDIYRAVDRLPGVTTHDITAKIDVRGAPNDQVLLQLDGLELSEPFHLKDWDGSLSIIDVESVNDIELMTGGFTAEYGDKMAGVLAMHTTTPPPNRTRTTIGFSVMNLTGKSEGGFASGRGTWLGSARYGFLGPTLKILDEANGAEPTYYDVFGKVQYQLSPRHLVSAHLLHAGDDFAVVEEDGTEVHSAWGSSYLWMNWTADFTHTLSAQTTISAGRRTRDRRGVDYDVEYDYTDGPSAVSTRVDDRGTFNFYGLKQNWGLMVSDRVLVRWGFDLRHGLADYDYYRWREEWVPNTTDPTAPAWLRRSDSFSTKASPSGQQIGLFQSNRLRLMDRFTVEVGLRYDHQSHTGDNTLSPRVNAAIDVAPRTTLRAAWGYYYQSHRLDELYVADGDDRFYPSQRAEHRILGLEHRLNDGTSFRVEAYERRISDPRPEYRSLVPTIQALWEEGDGDRVRVAPTRGLARGIEFLARRDVGRRFAWSASYALARADDEIGGAWVPRPRDQRHTVRLELAYRPTPSWSLSCAWQYHSGWPGTREDYEVMTAVDGSRFASRTFGPIYRERLPAYHRLDVRVSKLFPVGNGQLEAYLDVFNAYNRKNAEAFEYMVWITPEGRAVVERGINPLLRVFPTFGARWEF